MKIKTIDIGSRSYYAVPPSELPPAPRQGVSRAWYSRQSVKPPAPNRRPVTLRLPASVQTGVRSGPPVLNMLPNGEFEIMGRRSGVSLPGYRGPIPTRAYGSMLRLGLQATRLTPVGIIRDIAFDAAYDILSQQGPWAKWGEDQEQGDYQIPGLQQCDCNLGESADCPPPFRCSGVGVQVLSATAEGCAGKTVRIVCGVSGQVPSYGVFTRGEDIAINLPKGRRFIMMGPANVVPRYRVAKMYFKDRTDTPITVTARFIPGRSAPVLPTPSIPPPIALSESITEPSKAVRIRTRRYQRPAIETVVNSGGKQPPIIGNHDIRTPRKGEKEVKTNVNGSTALRLLGAVYDSATEAMDIVGVLYDAMDKKLPWRPGKPYNWMEQANFIYNNLGDLNLNKAVGGLIKNHLEDKFIYGKIFGTVGKHTGFGSMGPAHGGWLKI